MSAGFAFVRGVSRDERIKASLLSAWFFLTVATLWLLKSVRVTALLVHLGARETPYVRLAGVAAVGAAVFFYSIATSRLSRAGVVRAASAVFAVVLVAFWLAVRIFGDELASQRSFVWATYILVDVYAVVMVQIFWTYTNDVVTQEEANKLYGVIGLGGILGGAFGGAIVDAWARHIGTEHFMLVAAGLVVAAGALASITERVLAPAPREPKRFNGHLDSVLAGVQEVGKSRYLLLIVGVVIGYELTATLTDFGVNVMFEHAHLGERELAKMYGRLGWISSGVGMVAQIVLVPILLPSKRLALLLPPLALFASVVGVVILPVLATTIVMASVDRGLNYSIQQSTRESLYVPLDDTQKYKAKAFIDMFVDHAAKGVASMLLLVLIAFEASTRATLLVSCGSMVVWLFFARRLGHYAVQPIREPARRRLLRALLSPASYAPAIATAGVALHETHLSRVFVLDRDVLKIKKPVEIGALDLRTLDQREAACRAEVRLNERVAPGVYRGVVPIVRAKQGYTVGGEGTVIEWAVHMNRLHDDHRVDELLSRGALGYAEIDAIARRIAALHAIAPAAEEAARVASPDALARCVGESFAATRRILEHYLSERDIADVIAFQTSFLQENAALFARRAATGRVRDGHGDLRLEHVYLDDTEVVFVDCSHDERARVGDVCSDVACLSMDLAAHGRVELAERLLATYARETRDYEIYAVADFYESYHAFARGKVAAMVASDPSRAGSARRAAAEEARRYFVLAAACGRRVLLAPSVVAVGGGPGPTRRAIADGIRDETSAAVVVNVDADVLRHASVVLVSGRSVVLDASFRSAAMRRAAKQLAARHEVPFLFVECLAGGGVPRASGVEVELVPSEHVVVDASSSVERALHAVRSHLATWPRGLTA